MKWFLLNNKAKFYQTGFPSSSKLLKSLAIIFAIVSSTAMAEPPALPEVTARFANPVFDCPTQNYCVDVQFKCNAEGQWVYGANIRFFYDDAELEFVSMGSYLYGYTSIVAPEILTGPAGSGDSFGFNGPLEWFNGNLQLVAYDNPTFLSTSEWTTMFRVCFHVDDPAALDIENFCPPLVWDLQQQINGGENPPESGDGFLPGDDGLVVTVVDLTFQQESLPTYEIVEQFNWEYDPTGATYGYPLPVVCLSTTCGYRVPVSNWAVYLAIGLMLVVSVFIYRRRIAG